MKALNILRWTLMSTSLVCSIVGLITYHPIVLIAAGTTMLLGWTAHFIYSSVRARESYKEYKSLK